MTLDFAALDRRHLWHPFTAMRQWTAEDPLMVASGEGNYLTDTQGHRYLDGISSLWVNVHGHRCAPLDEAIRAQLDQVAHSTLLGLGNLPSAELAAALIAVAPQGLERVFYSDSGSTAVEVALKMAFQYWQHSGHPRRTHFVALDEAYHGDTIGAVSVGGIDLFHRLFHPLLFQTLRVASPHPYRYAGGSLSPEACRDACLAALEALLAARAEEIAALIIEPRVQGAAGIIVHPPGYLRGVAELCRRHQVLLICDEVATGFGRTGELFASQAEGVTPDLMTLAKGLSGGYLPLAATLTTEAIYEAFLDGPERTFFHGHSYTGNPLACAAGLASLRLFAERDLLTQVRARALRAHALLADHLAPLPPVGELRQCGLMIGVELVADRATRHPFPAERRLGAAVCRAARARGVILRPLGDVIVIMPPLSITDDELETIVKALASSIAETVQ
ncbi:MAG: adenosylmethionine--8-amino-7-oxononanoate transaminase [Proteobacteria bacterium]|nr:adenosylmethionine--8-amino-7-oxononanoate transaminase [Pseudomonadota bacterium]